MRPSYSSVKEALDAIKEQLIAADDEDFEIYTVLHNAEKDTDIWNIFTPMQKDYILKKYANHEIKAIYEYIVAIRDGLVEDR